MCGLTYGDKSTKAELDAILQDLESQPSKSPALQKAGHRSCATTVVVVVVVVVVNQVDYV